MTIRASMPTFAGGEIAPEVEARSDVAKYQTAARRVRNLLMRPAGGVVRRQGTLYESYARNEQQPVRLVPFQFSSDDQAVLEFGDSYMRVLAGGGYELEQDFAPTAVTNANPAVATFAGHGLEPGDDVFWTGVSGMVELNGQTTRVGATTASTFEIQLDTTGFGVFTGAAGASAYVAPTPSPPAGTPTPPAPPPPSTPPAPPSPDMGGGGGHYCVAPETMILMADRREIRADALRVGMKVRTQHETTLEWGDYTVSALSTVDAARSVYVSDGVRLVATPNHRIMLMDGRKAWTMISDLHAQPLDRGPVMQITVDDAHTYVSNGMLSHNIKPSRPPNPTD